MSRTTRGILYVMECGEGAYMKIGTTNTVESMKKRLKTLQTGNPMKINILHYEERSSATKAEKYLHQQFQDNRVMGEWFQGVSLHDIRVKLMLFHDQD